MIFWIATAATLGGCVGFFIGAFLGFTAGLESREP